ncbi:MAG: 1-acyl-sn-glycerol-3-phosphate acyltransferase [Deltaproteobacteria bacterium]|nr:1-acyl-sn-glycerol-3-phosphate acyltransferase [Candidatus Anaeroferrophillus wilburensis]MBN2888916.1 1-acyl-sn-glycerol-3-phosphate acyltransferase [Deltaproteobacteria bacterium]
MKLLKKLVLGTYSNLLVGISTLLWSTLGLLFCLLPPAWKLKGHNLCAHYWGTWILRGSGISVRVVGSENLKPGTQYMVIANHRSFLDIYILLTASGLHCRMVAKKELTKIPVFGLLLRYSDSIVIDRQNREQAIATMRQRGKLLKEKGLSIVVFPEGTRSTGRKELGNFKKGAFILAAQLGLPILPVTIVGAGELQPKGAMAIKPGSITLKIDAPLMPPDYAKPADIAPLAEQARKTIEHNLQTFTAAP